MDNIGDFAREGHTQTAVETMDHDFPSAGLGKLIPHGKSQDHEWIESHCRYFDRRIQDWEKCAADFIENARTVFDHHLPRWNYRASAGLVISGVIFDGILTVG